MSFFRNINNEFNEYINPAIQRQQELMDESVSRLLNSSKDKHLSLDEKEIKEKAWDYLVSEDEREPLLDQDKFIHAIKGKIKLEKLYEIMSKYDDNYRCKLNDKYGDDKIIGINNGITIEFTKGIGPSLFRINHEVRINIFTDWDTRVKRYKEVYNKFN